MKVKICPSCKAKFRCEENSSCWCYELPHISILDDEERQDDCICPSCLKIQVGN